MVVGLGLYYRLTKKVLRRLIKFLPGKTWSRWALDCLVGLPAGG